MELRKSARELGNLWVDSKRRALSALPLALQIDLHRLLFLGWELCWRGLGAGA